MVLPCKDRQGHWFHPGCILEWFGQTREQKCVYSCPQRRNQEVAAEDTNYDWSFTFPDGEDALSDGYPRHSESESEDGFSEWNSEDEDSGWDDVDMNNDDAAWNDLNFIDDDSEDDDSEDEDMDVIACVW